MTAERIRVPLGTGVAYTAGGEIVIHQDVPSGDMTWLGVNAKCWSWVPHTTMSLEEVRRDVGLDQEPKRPNLRVVRDSDDQ